MEPNGMQAFPVAVIFIVIIVLGVASSRRQKARDVAKLQAEIDAYKATHQARVDHQARSNQLNHGNRIFNWLKEQFVEYREHEIGLGRIQNNGPEGKGRYSIFISRLGCPNSPMIQLDFDLVGKHDGKGEVHVFYGAYGPDIYFSYLEHSPYYGLEKLVLRDVLREAAEMKARRPEGQSISA